MTQPNSDFVNKVKQWVLADNQLKIVNNKAKELRDLKNEITEYLCDYIDDQNNETEKILLSDGELRFYDKREVSSLTFDYIEDCLEHFISDKEKITRMIQYMKENREVSYVTDIKRIITKK